MNKKLILAAIIISLLIGLQWLYTHAYIEITVANPASDAVTYQLVNQDSQDSQDITSETGRAKRLVRRGNYELTAKQGEASYFTVVKTGGFLGTTPIQATLAPEKQRTFIGNNPSPCTHYTGSALISFGCGDSFSNARLHVPATAGQPTYTLQSSGVIEGAIEGMATTAAGSIVLIRAPELSEEQGAPHTLYTLGDNLELSIGTPLSDLDENTLYALRPYQSGFIIYDSSFARIRHYAAVGARPSEITVGQPADNTLTPYSLSVQGDTIAVAYSNNTQGEVADIHDPDDSKVKTEVAVLAGKQSARSTFEGQYSAALPCGTKKLCLLKNDVLEVYDITADKPRRLFTVGSVAAIEASSSGLLVAREKELLGLDVDTRQGSIFYSFGSYTYCGLQIEAVGYTLCLVNSQQEKVALRVNPTADNRGSIDKKVAELLKLGEVKDLSVYGRFIYVSPELGEPVYDESSNSFGYPDNVTTAVNTKINQEIARLGIDRNTYSVINAFE